MANDDSAPDPKDYMLCKTCTKKNEGRPVLVHKFYQVAGFFTQKKRCPLGHEIEPYGGEA